ncbi:polyprenyl synthetase family protein [Halapricum hydrolyticum]|uniref:Polyprenyl synthetase family protein n=1 Tax=Halapricum hydrolyticum TaxID=2979991 RepID=A0AAE3IEE3_9EURY|nr:polyprenyl synthetase family protein [Halapricum hydrolyticum]MCU4718761.1 polyprenyl synthetase family protein [Halapricum hydrolyticum]MCU4727748.1 polyprenyl synthetase family protein [Halapricum hydrolyticum]
MRDVLADWQPVIDEAIAEVLPRDIDEQYLTDFFGAPTYAYDPDAIQQALSDPIWDLLDRGGKRWRAVLAVQLFDGFGADPMDYLRYAIIPEILHNGTIIVDDVEDGASKRRGEPALHLEYGVDVALNAGNAMYFLPLKIITRNSGDIDAETRLEIYEMLMYELNRTHLGQGMDIWWHNEKGIRASESEYCEMSACKTGCIGRIVARLPAIITGQSAETERRVAEYAEQMSIAFQIGDDILDVEHTLDQAGEFGKEFGNDIREGKKTLMAIHAAEHAPPEDVARLEEILWAEENTDGEIMEAIEIYQSAGSIEYARERAEELAQRARESLPEAELDPGIAERLSTFTRFVIEREQ